MDSLCRAVRDLNAPSGGGGGGKGNASAAREKKPVNAHVVKSGMLRFNFMLGCCNPGTLPDAHLIAALLDLVRNSLHLSVRSAAPDSYKSLFTEVGGVAQWWNVGLWPANFPCPALDLQLMGDH